MNFKSLPLSEIDKSLLSEEIKVMNLALKYISIALPILVILTIACWYFNWHGISKFLTTTLSIALFILLAVCFIYTGNVRKDLAASRKVIVSYKLVEKYVEGDVNPRDQNMNAQKIRGRIDVPENEIQNAIDYQRSKESGPFPSDHFERILHYSYRVKVHRLDSDKDEEFIVPIDSYVKVQNGQSIEITYALNSRKVFNIDTR